MKSILVLAAFTMSAFAQTVWHIDPPHSAAQFAVTHMGISTVRGAFTKTSGTVHYDETNPKNDSVEVTIDASSIDTRVEMRDKDLRSEHYFDVQKYPTITFKSTSVESPNPGTLKVTGDLTMHGVTKQVTLDVEGPSKTIKDPKGKTRMGISASGLLKRTDFGIGGPPGGIGDEVKLTIDAELVAEGPGDAK